MGWVWFLKAKPKCGPIFFLKTQTHPSLKKSHRVGGFYHPYPVTNTIKCGVRSEWGTEIRIFVKKSNNFNIFEKKSREVDTMVKVGT